MTMIQRDRLGACVFAIAVAGGTGLAQDLCGSPIWPAETFGTTPGPVEIASADLDGDHDIDLVVVGQTEGEVAIHLNRGGGDLWWSIYEGTHAVGGTPRTVAIGDLDNDGHPDVVVGRAFRQKVSVFRNRCTEVDCDGPILADPIGYQIGTRCESLRLGDLNNDGFLDIVVANQVSDDLSILLNDGEGGFRPEIRAQAGDRPLDLELGDLDGDGYLDAVVASFETDDVRVLLGRGDGGFRTPTRQSVGIEPMSVTLADMDEDGDLDIVAGNAGSDDVSFLRNRGDGTFDPEIRSPGGEGEVSVEADDVDHDGDIDIVLTVESMAEIRVLPNSGDGTFDAPIRKIFGVRALRMMFADIDGDGEDDLVVTRRDQDALTILRGHPDGGYVAHRREHLDTLPHVIASADLDGDHHVDLVVGTLDGTVEILRNRGDATFDHTATMQIPEAIGGLTLNDVDLDGDIDICATIPGQGDVLVIRNDGHGNFDAGTPFHTGGRPFEIAGADMNGDVIPDLVMSELDAGSLIVALNDGAGSFPDLRMIEARPEPGALRVTDMDRDLDADVFLAHPGGFDAYTNDGSGSITRMYSVTRPGITLSMAVPSQLSRVALGTAGSPSYIRENVQFGDEYREDWRWRLCLPVAAVYARTYRGGIDRLELHVFDVECGRIVSFWNGTGTPIGEFNLDIDVEDVIADDLNGDGQPDLAIASTSGIDIILYQCVPRCLADWNRDEWTDVFDLIDYLEDFANTRHTADLNDDGIFDIFDVVAFLDAFDVGCP